ncbi:MAG TPA: division/cell wall cluster transcriptional repressor MraZ [Flavobacteriaceae bacterium]|nr:division/cell wall cluster transcriptional repressor MraZ [Flavobacteriaceae bacterium]
MAPSEFVQNFFETYQCKADAKGRVLIPSALLKKLAPIIDKGFVMKRSVFSKCLELFPMEEWERTMQKLNKLNRFNRRHMDFIRRYTAGVRVLELDANGRFLIPKDLMVHAGITKDITLSGTISVIEIWDTALYEAAIKENANDIDFADLAEDIMGGGPDDES